MLCLVGFLTRQYGQISAVTFTSFLQLKHAAICCLEKYVNTLIRNHRFTRQFVTKSERNLSAAIAYVNLEYCRVHHN